MARQPHQPYVMTTPRLSSRDHDVCRDLFVDRTRFSSIERGDVLYLNSLIPDLFVTTEYAIIPHLVHVRREGNWFYFLNKVWMKSDQERERKFKCVENIFEQEAQVNSNNFFLSKILNPYLVRELIEHQRSALVRLYFAFQHQKGQCLLDEMGLGKSITALALSSMLPDVSKVIIVCPAASVG
jgi:hypothetical protein